MTLLLASCASMPTGQAPQNQNITWGSRVGTLSSVEDWDLKGLIAIRAAKDGGSANWHWRQSKNNYTISLFGPFGANSFTLTGTPSSVLLETSDGKKFNATTPELLLAQQTGWQLPISNLYYWIRGLPVPGVPAQKQFDTYHHLTALTQQGWTIHYLRYVSVNQIDLPNKIFLDNSQVNVKIIINQWQF